MPTVATQRGYAVRTVTDAKELAREHTDRWKLDQPYEFGLPEIDDRYHVWRVPLVAHGSKVGEVVIDARAGTIDETRGSNPEVVAERLAATRPSPVGERANRAKVELSSLPNTILCGDSNETLKSLPPGSVDLVFTSPPYFNARPDYSDFASYDAYLESIRDVIRSCHRLLQEGRFFVMNIAPILVRRARRSESSRRIAVPFDMHRLFIEEGFDFIDDIIWEKPEGAGWATGRGRRFAADRNPLQYKAVPVTEYVLVYRKQTPRLIDWHIRTHPDQELVRRSRIENGYERTNVWKIKPASHPLHPAVFPMELAERVIRYYSFLEDVVLDPFAGVGTVGEAAVHLSRRFVLSEIDPAYVEAIRSNAVGWLGSEAARVSCVGCDPLTS
ncbi:MAG TPA: DNA methyltransferase [Gaiellaceae bacterium]|nr:DNA methyltransferase [Gaiellaceae bacterium]